MTARILTLVPTRVQQQRTDAPTSVVSTPARSASALSRARSSTASLPTTSCAACASLPTVPTVVEAGRLAGYLSENVRKWSLEAKNPFGQSQNPTMVATDVRGPVWSRASCPSPEMCPRRPPSAEYGSTLFPKTRQSRSTASKPGAGRLKGSAAEPVHGARRTARIPTFRDQGQRDRRLPAGDHYQPASVRQEFELRKRHPVRTATALASGHHRISTGPGRRPEFGVRL